MSHRRAEDASEAGKANAGIRSRLRRALADTPVDTALYYWRRNRWMLRPGSWGRDFPGVPVRGPIFFLGVQGGGLTLVSRVLRRHPLVISVTGDNSYWAGADEMHTVLGPLLLPEFTGIRHKPPVPDHERLPPPRSWTYATDELLPYYRLTEADAEPELRQHFLRVLRMLTRRHAADPSRARFVDKSQVYTVRVSFLQEILREESPRFVLVAMNPYAAVYKSAKGRAADMRRLEEDLELEERVELCAQHWANSYRAALEDGEDRLIALRFEDFLEDPEEWTRSVCEFVDLEFQPEMLPAPGQVPPLGTRYRRRWHPLRPSRTDRWIARLRAELGQRGIEIIERRCGDLADHFGYEAE